MNITFLIGNGFDLACNLKTKYTDVYEKYCIADSPNDNIKKFKETILKDNYKNWTDFEMALPRFGKELNNFDKFCDCVLDFTNFLDNYLIKEEHKIDIESNKSLLTDIMEKYIYYFYDYCLHISKSILIRLVLGSNENAIFNFITFNYTNTLEKCLSTIAKKKDKRSSFIYQYNEPIHLHSTLQNGILLGLDKEELYKDIPCTDIRKLKNLIDKVHINSRYSNITDHVLLLLQQSRIIVIFGWSMGESDSYWVESVKEIFLKNRDLQLVYVPYYSSAIDKRFRNQVLDREDEQKDFITKKFNIPKEERYRVHIIMDTQYMKLDFLVKNTSEEETLVTT